MITLVFGNIGSGKTAYVVREIFINESERKTYSNIKTTLKNQIQIKASMIIKKVFIRTKRTGEEVYKYELNKEFWQNINEPINVVIDEAHTILNARRGMSKITQIVNDWVAMLRRVLGSTDAGGGTLILISQLSRRIDIITRELATKIIYCVCHYSKTCRDCETKWNENSEMSERYFKCPNCNSSNIIKHEHYIEIWKFKNIYNYDSWHLFGIQNFYSHYYINDIEKYFEYYNTFQWDDLFDTID